MISVLLDHVAALTSNTVEGVRSNWAFPTCDEIIAALGALAFITIQHNRDGVLEIRSLCPASGAGVLELLELKIETT